MASSTLTSKVRITIPREVRDRLGLKEGDQVVFQFDEQGNLLLRQAAQSPLGRLPGLLKHLAKDRPAERFKKSVKR